MTTLRTLTGRYPNRLSLAALVVLATLAGCATEAWAATGEVHNLGGSSLNLTVDTRWVFGPGYQPVRVTVSRAKGQPANTDRSLTFEFIAGQEWPDLSDHFDYRVVQQIELPAGSQAVEATVSIPPLGYTNAYAFNVLEDGKALPRLCMAGTDHFVSFDDDSLVGKSPRMLVLGSNPPDTHQLCGSLYVIEERVDTNSPATLQTKLVLPELSSAITLPAASFPTRWIDYSSLDIVCLSLDELAQLAQHRPKAYRAVLTWTAVGGNLWVYSAGRDWHGLPELEKLLDLPPVAADSPAKRGWTEPSKKLHGEFPWDNGKGMPCMAMGHEFITPEEVDKVFAAGKRSPPDPPDRPHFLFRPHGMGVVVALAASNPFPGDRYAWAWLLKATDENRWIWHERHGMSTREGNRDFWNFSIPGVGLAPVVAFQVLISVFVLVIGPVNYWLLRRWGRLHLLVVTIPLAAVVVTVSLFGYGLIADGFQTRVRARSVTRLDQRRGQAVCWTRLSYYSGLAPADGLTFPDDVAVLPMPQETDYDPRKNPRELIWQPNEQWLASGWLASRVPTQYMTVRSRPSKLRLEIKASGEKSGQIAVSNRLGTPLEQLLLRTGEGKYYATTHMETGATARLRPVDPTAAFGRLRTIYQENQPAFPPGLQQTNRNNLLGSRRSFRYRTPYGSGYFGTSSAVQRTGLLEQSLKMLAMPTELQPGSYVAIVRESPEVVLGTPAAHEQASFHVIIGDF